jgi:hypothetical protein
MSWAQRIGRRMRVGSESTPEAEPPRLPAQRDAATVVRRTARPGAFCRAEEIGQTAVTASGRAVVAIPTQSLRQAGRWVYAT